MSGVHVRRSLAVCVGLLVVGGFLPACSSPQPAPAPPAPKADALWGDMKAVVSVKELMHDMIDPASDYVFNAVSIVDTKGHSAEVGPKTDDDWDKIRIGAVTMAEGAYLLKVPRPFAPAGDLNNSTGPDAEELAPAAILAKLQADPVKWNARIEALRNVGLQVLDIVKTKDVKQLWDASDNLDTACENCHVDYWYPGEGELFKKLDKRLIDLYGPYAGAKR